MEELTNGLGVLAIPLPTRCGSEEPRSGKSARRANTIVCAANPSGSITRLRCDCGVVPQEHPYPAVKTRPSEALVHAAEITDQQVGLAVAVPIRHSGFAAHAAMLGVVRTSCSRELATRFAGQKETYGWSSVRRS